MRVVLVREPDGRRARDLRRERAFAVAVPVVARELRLEVEVHDGERAAPGLLLDLPRGRRGEVSVPRFHAPRHRLPAAALGRDPPKEKELGALAPHDDGDAPRHAHRSEVDSLKPASAGRTRMLVLLARVVPYGELPPDPRRGRPKGSPARRIAAARAEALLALLLAAVPAAVAGAALRAAAPVAVAAAGLATAALALGVVAAASGRRATLAGALGGAAFLAAAATAGTLAPPVPPLSALALLALPPFLALAGLRLHATALAVDTGGAGPRRAPWRRALHVARASDALVARRLGVAGLALRVARLAVEALAAGPTVLAEEVAHGLRRSRAALGGRAVAYVHGEADLAVLAEAAQAAGHGAQAWGGTLVLVPGVADPRRLDRDEPGALDQKGVRVTRARLRWPAVAAADQLVLVGPPLALRRARRVVEHDLAFVCRFTWCAEARRLERRVNAMRADAALASTVEERSLLLQEAQRLEQLAVHRAWTGEEAQVLLAKLARVRLALQDALLNDPVGVKDARRTTAPGPVLAPDLGALVAAGGLGAVRAVTYVAYWVVPLDAPSGEWEIAVNAATGRFDRADSAAVLRAIEDRGATHFVDGQRTTRFVAPPPSTAALVAEAARAAKEEFRLKDAWIDPALADVVYVPFVDAPDGRFLNAVTGAESEDVKKALPSGNLRAALVE